MNIGIDVRAAKWYRGTGIGTYAYQLINALSEIDRINKYLLFMPEKNTYIPIGENFFIKNIRENNKSNFWDEVAVPNEFVDDTLSLYHVPQNGIGLPRKKKCPYVITLHDVIPYKMPQTVSDTYLKIFLEEMPKIISKCDGIITVSNYSKKDIIETLHYPENKIYVTHLASENIYKPLEKQSCKNFIKKNYFIEDDFILYIGGFSPRKNIVKLIESFSKINSRKNLKLIIGGTKGQSYSIYKQRSIDLSIEESVLFPGFIPINHLPFFYNAAELFVYPSLYEGFGLPPIEAMACGTPVIASNVTSIPEILEDGAYLINPQDVDDLAKSMIKVLEDAPLRQLLIQKGFMKSKSLTWKNTGVQTLKAYNNIVNNL